MINAKNSPAANTEESSRRNLANPLAAGGANLCPKKSNVPLVAIDRDPGVAPLLEVHWILTRRCQYNCWYCPPHRHDPKAQHATESILIAGLARLVQYIAAPAARINLTGGEPTMHPAILAFVRAALTAKPIRAVRIVTNLAAPLLLFSALASINRQNGGVQIVASFHPERAQASPFMERVETLASGGVPVLIKVLTGGDGNVESVPILAELRRVWRAQWHRNHGAKDPTKQVRQQFQDRTRRRGASPVERF